MNKKEAIQAMLDGKCVQFGNDIIYRFRDSYFWVWTPAGCSWRLDTPIINYLPVPAEAVPDPSIEEICNKPVDVATPYLTAHKRQAEINEAVLDAFRAFYDCLKSDAFEVGRGTIGYHAVIALANLVEKGK